MSSGISERGVKVPPEKAVEWSRAVDDLAAAQCKGLGVTEEQLPEVERARYRDEWKQLFRITRGEVLDRYGSEIRAEAHQPFREGRLQRTQALNFTIDFLRNASEHGKQVLVLSGGTGLGKTLAALYGLAWHAAARPALSFGQHLHAVELAERVKPWTSAQQAQRINVHGSFVVLDDLGSEDHENVRFREACEAFFNARQGIVQGHPQITIITTNKPLFASERVKETELLFSRYSERVRSRLKGLTRAYELTGEDLRGRKS